MTALMDAAINARAKGAVFLFASGASVNQADVENKTALMHATFAGHTEVQKILKLAGAPGDIVEAGDDACYLIKGEALAVLHRFFGQRLQSILRSFMHLLFISVNTLLLVHVQYKNTDINNNDSSLPALSLELWYYITRLIPLSFANGVLKYGDSYNNSTTFSSAEICPHVDFVPTSSNVYKIKYGAGFKSQNLTKKDLGIDAELLMRSIV